MQKTLKILMKLFLIALFRKVHWLLFRNKMQVDAAKLRLVVPKTLAHPATKPIALDGGTITTTERDRETGVFQLIFGVE